MTRCTRTATCTGSPPCPSGGVIVVPGTGVVLTCSGTFTATETHSFPCVTMGPSSGNITAAITALLADPDTAEQTGRDIQATARRLARLTGSDTLTLHIPGPCPNTRCGRAGRRYRRDGSDLIVCGACGLTETMDAHEERAARLLTELRRRGLRDQDQDQESATRCLATDRAGNPCGRDAIRGATMCPTHQLLTELRGEQART